MTLVLAVGLELEDVLHGSLFVSLAEYSVGYMEENYAPRGILSITIKLHSVK